jgi:hypothetical protein
MFIPSNMFESVTRSTQEEQSSVAAITNGSCRKVLDKYSLIRSLIHFSTII